MPRATSLQVALALSVSGLACGRTLATAGVAEAGTDSRPTVDAPAGPDVTSPGDGSTRDSDAPLDVTLPTEAAVGPDAAAGCNIGGVSYAASMVNPQNVCQSCQPGLSRGAWSDVANGAACDAGVCQAGSCGSVCPASCTVDSECQSQCPSAGSDASGLVNCCDQMLSKCVVVGTPDSICPDLKPVCPSQCTSDQECQSGCPVSPSATPICCNAPTARCTPSSTGACPNAVACVQSLDCISDSDCVAMCSMVPTGFTPCCYRGDGSCYFAQGVSCPI